MTDRKTFPREWSCW